MIEFPVGDGRTTGYLALPKEGKGAGVLVLHAWWGLNDFFKQFCDRLAAESFVVLAPDLYHGAIATTIDEAEQRIAALDFEQATREVSGAIDYLRDHAAVRGDGLGVAGFSMGAAYALLASTAFKPEDIAAVVTFYGMH